MIWVAALGATVALPSLAADAGPGDAARVDAPVPQVQYRSAFDTPTGVEERSIDWKRANEEVAQFPRGHADLLKWEETQQRGSSDKAPPAQPAPATQGQPDGHHGH